MSIASDLARLANNANVLITSISTNATSITSITVGSQVINATGITVYANGTVGTNGQILTSNGSVSYWANGTAGASGGGADKAFWENDTTITTNYTITTNKNAMTAGPVTVNSGVVITIPSGSVWTVV